MGSISVVKRIEELLSCNIYPGRGIIIGMSKDGKHAVSAYFIMGRSENSRNRIFVREGRDVTIYPHDVSKVSDPSLIIYSPVRDLDDRLIVTNGDQTDTIKEHLLSGGSFESAQAQRCFEPDPPNFTPRISGMISFLDGRFAYKLGILKSADENGTACDRYTYSYEPIAGFGHLIHTYEHDGNPLPTFLGEPRRIFIGNDINETAASIWQSLDLNNRISLYVRYTDIATREYCDVLINKNEGKNTQTV